MCIALLALSAASARADTYCVNAPGCDATHDKGTDLQAALTAAEGRPGPDDVVVGGGVYTGTGFHYDSPDAVHIDGAGGRSFGRDGPTLVDTSSGNPSGQTQLQVLGTSHSTISGIDVVVPGGSGSGNTGIETTGRIDDVLVQSDDPASTDATGVRLDDGAVMANTDVLLGRRSPLGDGVAIAGAGVSMLDSRIDASQGVVTAT
ncbi:MAG: hypothetical protein QOC77_1226, partial [Thermoleophilaceae bacterium]|nr:hypothetical protein [Thermoleophilaceae bacterium]